MTNVIKIITILAVVASFLPIFSANFEARDVTYATCYYLEIDDLKNIDPLSNMSELLDRMGSTLKSSPRGPNSASMDDDSLLTDEGLAFRLAGLRALFGDSEENDQGWKKIGAAVGQGKSIASKHSLVVEPEQIIISSYRDDYYSIFEDIENFARLTSMKKFNTFGKIQEDKDSRLASIKKYGSTNQIEELEREELEHYEEASDLLVYKEIIVGNPKPNQLITAIFQGEQVRKERLACIKDRLKTEIQKIEKKRKLKFPRIGDKLELENLILLICSFFPENGNGVRTALIEKAKEKFSTHSFLVDLKSTR